MDRERLATWIAILVAVVWTISLGLDVVLPTYDPPPSVHAAMMIVVGWAFGEHLLRRNGNGRS